MPPRRVRHLPLYVSIVVACVCSAAADAIIMTVYTSKTAASTIEAPALALPGTTDTPRDFATAQHPDTPSKTPTKSSDGRLAGSRHRRHHPLHAA